MLLGLKEHKRPPPSLFSPTTVSRARLLYRRRMAPANNLETHRCHGLAGRVQLDVLRFLLMRNSPKLASYKFGEACERVMHERPPSFPARRLRHMTPSELALVLAHECAALSPSRAGPAYVRRLSARVLPIGTLVAQDTHECVKTSSSRLQRARPNTFRRESNGIFNGRACSLE